MSRVILCTIAAFAWAACLHDEPSDPTSADDLGYDGTGVRVSLAALSYPEVADVCYSFAVANAVDSLVAGRGPSHVDPARHPGGVLAYTLPDDYPAATAAGTTVCSSRYGDGPGGAWSFVAPCDATEDHADTTVTVWLDGLHLEGGVEATGGVDYHDPCPTGCARTVTCQANADVGVTFDLTVLRAAQQGFFDIAVSFGDVFCSAKYDCGGADEPLAMLHDATGARERTHVLAVSCASSPDGDGATLWLTDLTISCAGASPSVSVVPPLAGDGNLCTPGGADGAAPAPSGCVDGVSLPADGPLFQAAAYKGETEQAGFELRYLNVALGLEHDFPPGTTCDLALEVTVDRAEAPAIPDGVVAPGQVYPYIEFAIEDLDACATSHALNASDSGVTTAYTTTDGTGRTFPYRFDAPGGAEPEGPDLPTDGLILNMSFDEGGPTCGGLVCDHSGLDHHGEVVGSITWSQDTAAGLGYSIDTGTDLNWVRIPSTPALTPADALTVSAWVKGPYNGEWNAIVGKGSTNSYRLYVSATGLVRWRVNANSAWYIDSTIAIDPDRWTHLAATYDGSTLALYIDGELHLSGGGGGNINVNSQPLGLGALGGEPNTYHHRGSLDRVRIYSRVLDAEGIAALAVP